MKIPALVLLLVLAAACKKKTSDTSSGGANSPNSASVFNVKNDGIGYSNDNLQFASSNDTTVIIAQKAEQEKYFVYGNFDSLPQGTYTFINGNSNGNIGIAYQLGPDVFTAFSGQVIVGQNDMAINRLTLSFSVTVKDQAAASHQLTQGTLNCTYP